MARDEIKPEHTEYQCSWLYDTVKGRARMHQNFVNNYVKSNKYTHAAYVARLPKCAKRQRYRHPSYLK